MGQLQAVNRWIERRTNKLAQADPSCDDSTQYARNLFVLPKVIQHMLEHCMSSHPLAVIRAQNISEIIKDQNTTHSVVK